MAEASARDSPPGSGLDQLREVDNLDLCLLVDGPLEARARTLSERRAAPKPSRLQRSRDRLRRVVPLHMTHRVPLPQAIGSLGEDLHRGARALSGGMIRVPLPLPGKERTGGVVDLSLGKRGAVAAQRVDVEGEHAIWRQDSANAFECRREVFLREE